MVGYEETLYCDQTQRLLDAIIKTSSSGERYKRIFRQTILSRRKPRRKQIIKSEGLSTTKIVRLFDCTVHGRYNRPIDTQPIYWPVKLD